MLNNSEPRNGITAGQNWKRWEKENESIFKQKCSVILLNVSKKIVSSERFISIY